MKPRSSKIAAIVLLLAGTLCAKGGSLALIDDDGRKVDPFDGPERVRIFLFTRADCPISNRYAPEVRRLYDRFRSEEVGFWLVYPDPDASAESILSHRAEYDYPVPALRDPEHALVRLAGAQITPEAAVFVGETMVYRGRIDDRYVDFGKARAEPTTHDLRAAIESALRDEKRPLETTRAVGCFIADLE